MFGYWWVTAITWFLAVSYALQNRTQIVSHSMWVIGALVLVGTLGLVLPFQHSSTVTINAISVLTCLLLIWDYMRTKPTR